MNKVTFSDGSFALHHVQATSRTIVSAWYAKDGTLLSSEAYDKETHRVRKVNRDWIPGLESLGRIWKD